MKPINNRISYMSLRGISDGKAYTTYGSTEGFMDFDIWAVHWSISNTVFDDNFIR